MPRLFSYTVRHDHGFAPNPFFGFCTLATCKPRIRQTASVGDWIAGGGTKSKGRGGHLVYAMRVTEAMTFDEYWDDPRFLDKRPDKRATFEKGFGDNIYHRDKTTHRWRQAPSKHSNKCGKVNMRNLRHDTQVDRVLVSEDFIYYGGSCPLIPTFRGCNLYFGLGHKCRYPDEVVEDFISWIRSFSGAGLCGRPLEWDWNSKAPLILDPIPV